MQEYPRYFMGSTHSVKESERILKRLKEEAPFNELKQEEELKRFSLDRYMRENIFMIHDDSPLIDLKMNFREVFIGTLLTQFNLNRFRLRAFFTGKYFDDGEKFFGVVVTVQENDGRYQWLLQHVNDLIVVEPDFVRLKLKKCLQKALIL